MIAFVAMLLVVFLRAPFVGKIKIILAVVLFLAVTATMPGKLIARYKTIAEDDADDTEMNADMRESASSCRQSWKQLLWHSLIFTRKHPVFGVGPGMFVVADDAYMRSLGFRKGTWLGTHNNYAEVSSELGIPASLCVVTAVWLSLKSP